MTPVVARCAMVAFLFASAASAQWPGRIQGQVVDIHALPLEGVDVRLRCLERPSLEYAVTTGSDGAFEIMVVDSLLLYDLSIEKEGYAAYCETLDLPYLKAGTVIRNVFLGHATFGPGRPVAADARSDAVRVFNRGISWLLVNNPPAADVEFQLALEIDPSFREAGVARLRVLVELREWERAVAYSASLGKDGVTGDEFDELRDYARANVVEQASERIAAVRATYLEALGAVRDGDLARGEELLTRVIDQDPRHADAYYERGMILLGTDRKPAAATDFRRYLELSPRGAKSAEAREILDSLDE